MSDGAGKTASVVEQLRAEIRRGSLAGRLPGMRALAAAHSVSTFVIFQAVAILEADGLVVRLPKRGVEVPAAVTARVRRLRLIIAEHLPWQQRFWEEVRAGFSATHPEIVTTCVFVPGRAAVAEALADGAGGVVHSISPDTLPAAALVPLAQVLGKTLAPLRAGLTAAAGPGNATSLPYQLQPAALVYKHHHQAPLPADLDWATCISALAALHGPRRLVPPPVQILADAFDLGDAFATALAGRPQALAERAVSLVGVMADLVAAEVLADPFETPMELALGLDLGKIEALMRSSFLWPVLGLRPEGPLAVHPLPGQVNPCPLSVAVAAGVPDRAAAAVWIAHLMSDQVQRLIMVHGLGTAAQRSALIATAGDRGLPRGMDALAARMLVSRPREAVPAGYPALLHALVERCLLPLVTGRLTAASARANALAVVAEAVATATAQDANSQDLRLRQALMTER